MGKIEYPESHLERDYVRDALRRSDNDGVDEVAQAIRERWAHSPLRSYRLAKEMSLEEVCEHVNRLLETFAGEPGYFDHSTLSRFEHWPTKPKSRRPTVSHLVALAQVYGTNPRKLVPRVDWKKFPPADRYALQLIDSQANAGTTGAADTRGMMETLRPPAGYFHSPHTPWTPSDPTQSGNTTERLIIVTGDETAQYGDRASAVGEVTIDQLRADTAGFARRFGTTSRIELFSGLRLLRDRLFRSLDTPGRVGVSQTRDLHFLGGAVCGMLARVTEELGYPSAALSHIRTGLLLAQEASADNLVAWLHGEHALTCYWNGQYSKARDHARRGQNIHPVGTVAVFLPAMEARASGGLHDAQASRAAYRRAVDAREHLQLGSLDEFGGLMGFNEPKQHFYVASACLEIGDNSTVISEAESAISGYEVGPPEDYNYPNVAIVRLHAAVAQVRSDDLDAARSSASAALDVPSEYQNANTSNAARQLYNHLRIARFRESPVAVEMRDKVEEFLSVTPARLEFS